MENVETQKYPKELRPLQVRAIGFAALATFAAGGLAAHDRLAEPPARPAVYNAVESAAPSPVASLPAPSAHPHRPRRVIHERYPLAPELTAALPGPADLPAAPMKTPGKTAAAAPKPTARGLAAHSFVRPANSPLSWVDRLPGLDELAGLFPASFPKVGQEETYIHELAKQVSVTPADYKKFKLNTDYEDAFASQPSYFQSIDPKLFVVHWTAVEYQNGVQEFIKVMRREGLRVEFFIDHDGAVYKLFNSDTHYPAHALGVNSFSQGVEVEAKNVYGYTPAQLKSVVLLATRFCLENNLPVNRATILGHYGADLLYNNPTYDKYSGTFHADGDRKPYLGKIDPPQEVIDFIVRDASNLARQLSK